MASDIDLVITKSKRLEGILERYFHADGKGLHQKADSVRDKLTPAILKRLHFIATVRNKIVHETDYTKIDDRNGFIDACKLSEQELLTRAGVKSGGWLKWVVFVVAMIVGMLVAWFRYFR